MNQWLVLLNAALPTVLSLYKSLRAENPDTPALTDAQLIDLLSTDSSQIVSKATAWLAIHPKPTT